MSNGLKGDQYKLDMNKDGKLTAKDFEEVRKSRRSGGLLSGDDFMINMSEGGQFEERQPYVFGSLVRQISKGAKSLLGKKKKTKEELEAIEEDIKKNPDLDPDNYDSLLDARYFDDYDPDKMIVISFDGEDISLGQAKEKLARMREELEMFRENQIDSRNADKEKFLEDEIMDLTLEIEEAELVNRGDFNAGGLLEERQPYVFGSLVRQLSKGAKSLFTPSKKQLKPEETKIFKFALTESEQKNIQKQLDENLETITWENKFGDKFSLPKKEFNEQLVEAMYIQPKTMAEFKQSEIENYILGKRKEAKYEGGLLESDDSRYGMNEGGEMEEENEMLPDEEMEQNFIDFVVGEALSDEEKSMLEEQLEANPELSVVFDKVVEKASEFTGAGPVEGPGTGTSDDIPARLSDGEFVFTAKAVEQLGADNLMQMMKDAEAAYDEERVGYANGDYVQRLDGEQEVMNNDKKVTVEYNVNPAGQTNDSLLNRYDAGIMAEDETDRLVKSSMIEGKPYVRS